MSFKTWTVAILAVLALATVAFALPKNANDVEQQTAFINFMQKYKVSYASDEFQYRFRIFRENNEMINTHNAKPNKSFTMAINHLAALTDEEYTVRMLGFRAHVEPRKNVVPPSPVKNLPESIDWREKNAVTRIKDQASCGSCWAFAATGTIEGVNAVKTGVLHDLSEQQLVDCSRAYGNYGCNGGLMTSSFNYIIDNKGLTNQEVYPYESGTGNDNFPCRYQPGTEVIQLSSYKNVPSGSEASLQDALVNVGPIAVAIDAGQSSFRFYDSGVYDEPLCSSSRLNHGVTLIGYGTEGGKEYYLVKNSWGERWGDEGLIKMSRNKQNQCGIATMSSYPVMA